MDYLHFLLDTVGREWVWGLFLNGFCVHLTRPLVLILVFAIAFAGFGRGIGLPALFLRPRPLSRFAIGAGVGVLVWQVVLAGYLFEEFATNYTIDRPPFCEVRPDTSSMWSYADADYVDVVTWPGHEHRTEAYRYRYAPADVTSIARYAAGLGGAGLAVGAVVFLFWAGRAAVMAVRGGGGVQTTRPADPWAVRAGRYVWLRVPFVLGMATGVGVAGVVAWVFLPNDLIYSAEAGGKPLPVRAAYRTGEWVVELGGWGNASARAELIDAGVTNRAGGEPGELRDLRARVLTDIRKQFEPYYPVYGVFFLGFLAVLWWNVGLLLFTRSFSPAAGILLLAHLAVGFQTFTDYFFPTPQLLQFLLLGLIVLFARRYKMRFSALADHYRDPIPLQQHYDRVREESLAPTPTAEEPEPLAPLHTSQLGRWNAGPKRPLVMVCVSGGGSRAAAWTVRVLTELERRLVPKGVAFPYHVRMITGASGGMLGAAYYTASLPPPDGRRLGDDAPALPRPGSGEYPSRHQLNDTIRRDFLSPVVQALVKNDLPRLFQPFQYGGDRGSALETAWSECLGGWLDQSFADLWAGEREGWRPSLAFSPMLVEDGRQLVISNLSLRRTMINLGRMPGQPQTDDVLSREGLEFFNLFALDGRDPVAVRKAFRLATAARMSATFPYLFPAVPLPTTPRRRVVDAGYYDNYGTALAAGWLFTHIGWLRERVSHVAVVHIRDGVSTNERLMTRPAGDTASAVGLAAEGLTTPPVGLWNMRSATNTFRNDNLLHLLNLFFRENGVPFVTAAFEFPGGDDVSLNFCLPDEEVKVIDGDRGIEHPDIQQDLREFVDWWPVG